MKRLTTVVFAFLALSILAVSDASAFSCGTRLASVGDTKAEISYKCGSPDWVDSWEEARAVKVIVRPQGNGKSNIISKIPIYNVIYVLIEEWTYNLGPNQFMRLLRFENNRLIDIQTGSYGY